MPSKAFLVVAAVLAWVAPSRAFHTTFDYQVDRFEIDGNAFGASDGVPDLVDDFGEASGACGKVAFARSACRFPQSRRIVCR